MGEIEVKKTEVEKVMRKEDIVREKGWYVPSIHEKGITRISKKEKSK
ncbi:hypothetical protein BMS3Bbin15_00606 [archaeon BMS3Bbin15]|nr:hypothetical protein BMS3Bbin15_00606 [archaeon BMS3Bbin15]